eukprot:m.327804 g.327804  ORF g.327804 m.327804 type:complete len:1044 (-) comp20422_c0_seq1:344-3475(-)
MYMPELRWVSFFIVVGLLCYQFISYEDDTNIGPQTSNEGIPIYESLKPDKDSHELRRMESPVLTPRSRPGVKANAPYHTSIFKDHANANRLLKLLNLEYPGLEKVRKACAIGNVDRAIDELFDYYKWRCTHWSVVSHTYTLHKSITYADLACNNTMGNFGGATPPLTVQYGPGGINWTHNPFWDKDADTEWIWGLHRQPFWLSLAWAYKTTENEQYAKTWVAQFESWLEQCPRDPQFNYDTGTHKQRGYGVHHAWPNPIHPELSWAWRRIDAGKRALNFAELMSSFITSPHFTREVLVKVLNSVHEHVTVLADNPHHTFTYENHGLYEAEGAWAVGVLFPEFRSAGKWRRTIVEYLVEQLDRQVRPDGFQTEGVVAYHSSTIRIFYDAQALSIRNNVTDTTTFPLWFSDRVQDMMQALTMLLLPSKESIQFGDQGERSALSFSLPDQKTSATAQRLKYSGYYSIRSNLSAQASALILRCGPSVNAHMHKDAGSFEFAVGSNLILSDSGAYTYRGIHDAFPSDQDRAYFDSTAAHNTLTLNQSNAHTPSLLRGPYAPSRGYDDCGLLHWAPTTPNPLLIVENRFTYRNPKLSHRRAVVHFTEPDIFVIVDEAYGPATGTVEVHFHANAARVIPTASSLAVRIPVGDGGEDGAYMQGFVGCGLGKPSMTIGTSYASAKIGRKTERAKVTYGLEKRSARDVARFITAIVPAHAIGYADLPQHAVRVKTRANAGASSGAIELTVLGKQFVREYAFDPEGLQMAPPPDSRTPEGLYAKYYRNFRRSVATEDVLPTRNCKGGNGTCDFYNKLGQGQRHLQSVGASLVVVNKTKKYIYCGIPKCGVSKWRRLSRLVEGIAEWHDTNAHTIKSGLLYLSEVYANSSQAAEALVNDPAMHMFAIVRNPYARLLSAWLDKKDFPSFRLPQTFAGFVDYLVHTPNEKLNEHFAPLTSFCGLSEGIRFDAVYKLEEADKWGPSLVKQLDIADAVANPHWKGGFFGKASAHDKNADQKLQEYYTPTLMMHIRWKYREDFANFGYDPEQLVYGDDEP